MSKLQDYMQFAKLRLSLLVIFSSAMGFALASGGEIDWLKLIIFLAGGFLVTGSSNGFNQVLEKNSDKLMSRTSHRPLPAGRMSLNEGIITAGLMATAGIFLIYRYVNPLTGLISFVGLFLYTFAYTPMKKISPIAVLMGAIPGAFPPMLGWTAATGTMGAEAWVLFAIQFIWQFPHFWAIAWVLDEDYSKAGIHLLPSRGGKDRFSAFQMLVYSAGLIPVGVLPWFFGMSGIWSAIVIALSGAVFSLLSLKLLQTCATKDALRLMFASFIYLPVVQLIMVIDKV